MTQVLIAGAGPVGLWLAAELRLHDIDVTVLEREAGRDPRSKAVGMQANTLDALAMRGLAETFLERGIPVSTGHFGGASTRLDFAALDTPHPHMLAIPQALTESLLEEHARALGADVRRQTEVTGVEQDETGVTVRVGTPRGEVFERAEYLVGCEGTRSAVRHAAGIDFPGTPTTLTGWLADLELADPPRGVIGRADQAGSLLIVPIGGGLHRAAGTNAATMHLPPDAPLDLSEVQALAVELLGTDHGMHSPRWLSRYGNATRQAERYRAGRALLAGDAAHQFFPAGGQGMNLGIQDALNLGWKLAATIQGWGPAGLLDTYDEERRPVAQAIMHNTRAQLALFAAATPEQTALRDVFSETLTHPEINRIWARRVAGFDEPRPAADGQHPLIGHRIAELTLSGPQVRPHRLMAQGQFLALDLTGTATDAELDLVAAGHRRRLATHSATVTSQDPVWAGVSAVLVRPDGRIAWTTSAHGDTERLAALTEACERWCAATSVAV